MRRGSVTSVTLRRAATRLHLEIFGATLDLERKKNFLKKKFFANGSAFARIVLSVGRTPGAPPPLSVRRLHAPLPTSDPEV